MAKIASNALRGRPSPLLYLLIGTTQSAEGQVTSLVRASLVAERVALLAADQTISLARWRDLSRVL